MAGPIFSIDPKKLNDSSGIAAWAQAVVSAVAIIVVYVAATIPVRVDNLRRATELRLRSQGLALLLIPEIVTLKGELETAIGLGTPYDPPLEVPTSLIERANELYILGEIGGRLLQTIGMIRGLAVQTRRFQAAGMTEGGVPVETNKVAGVKIWNNHVRAFRLCLMNVDEAIEQLQTIIHVQA